MLAYGNHYYGIDLLKFDAGGGLTYDLFAAYRSGGWETQPDSAYPFGVDNARWSISANTFLAFLAGKHVISGPNGHLWVFSETPVEDEYLPYDERNTTRLRRVAATNGWEYEWTRLDGSVWVFGSEVYDGGENGHRFLVEIRDPAGHQRVSFVRPSALVGQPSPTRIDFPGRAARLNLSYTGNQLSSISIDSGSGTTATTIWEFGYALGGSLNYMLDGTGAKTLLSYSAGQLATVQREKNSDTTTLVSYTWSNDRVASVHDATTWASFSYDNPGNDGRAYTIVTDEAHGTPKASATYTWYSYGSAFARMVENIASSSGSVPCFHCDRGVGFQYDHQWNRAATLAPDGTWTTAVFDNETTLVHRAGSGVGSMSEDRWFTDSGVDFEAVGVQPGDTFRYLHPDGERGCALPVNGRLCATEWKVLSIIDADTLEIEWDFISDPPEASFNEYWIIRRVEQLDWQEVAYGYDTDSIQHRYILRDDTEDFSSLVPGCRRRPESEPF